MSLKTLNSVGGFGIDNGNVIIQANGDVTTTNLTVSNIGNISNLVVVNRSNLGSVSNVVITGGSTGQFIRTDGLGNLTFATPEGSGGGQMPYYIPDGEAYTVEINKQGLFAYPITIDGDLVVNGILIDVSDNGADGGVATALDADLANVIITGGSSGQYLQTDGTGNLSWAAGGGGGSGSPAGVNTQIQFNDAGSFGANLGFTFNKTTGTLNALFFSGAGNALSNIQGANVSGAVGLATYATTANSVAGANVTGAVSYATTANSVAVANVSGIGNIATVNLDGNASNILYGNGVFSAAPAVSSYDNSNVATFLASFGANTITTTGNVQVGNIIGNGQALTSINGANVTGTVANATYATSAGSATSATTAGTVTTAAQPNITSVGTLTSLSVSGSYTAGVFALGTSGSIALDPTNGTIQTCALTGNPVFTDSLTAGQSIVLMLTNGSSYTITWPTTTWVTSSGNVAPTLTAASALVFWKISTTLYGAYVGSYV